MYLVPPLVERSGVQFEYNNIIFAYLELDCETESLSSPRDGGPRGGGGGGGMEGGSSTGSVIIRPCKK